MSIKDTMDFIRDRRKAELAQANKLWLELLVSDNELYDVEKKLRSMRLDSVLGKPFSKADYDAACAKKADILKSKGITDEMLAPPPHCKICGDTGLTPDGPCRCVIAEETAATGNPEGPSFDDCDFGLFGSQADDVKKVYAVMQKYCEKYPETKKLNIIISGRCGCGKTFLASAMGRKISDKGYSVFSVTAFGFINDMLRYHLAPLGDKNDIISPYLECDVLIIDDLGSETKLNNVSEEYLYLVISERILKKHCTIITTNLDKDSLRDRYGDRIISRLFDANISISCSVSDIDLRSIKK